MFANIICFSCTVALQFPRFIGLHRCLFLARQISYKKSTEWSIEIHRCFEYRFTLPNVYACQISPQMTGSKIPASPPVPISDLSREPPGRESTNLSTIITENSRKFKAKNRHTWSLPGEKWYYWCFVVGLDSSPGKGMRDEAPPGAHEGNATTFLKKGIRITTSIPARMCTNKVEGRRPL